MAYNTLNRLKWTERLPLCPVVIRHRGAPGDRKVVQGSDITEVRKGCFSYVAGTETTILMHRILEVRVGPEVTWKRPAH